MGQHVEEVALLGIDDLLHLGQLVAAKAFLGESLQKLLARVGDAPNGAEFGFVFEELGQLAEEHFHELLRGHRRAVGVPEGRAHHVLDGAVFAVGEFHLRLFLATSADRVRGPGSTAVPVALAGGGPGRPGLALRAPDRAARRPTLDR